MRIAVIAAGGRTGRLVVAEAERRSHDVVAFTRRPESLNASNRLVVVAGNVADPATLGRGLESADAVISTMPGGNRAAPHTAERVTGSLIAAMSELGMRRLVVTSAYPIVAERPRIPLWLLRRMLRTAYADVARMEALVTASGLDWTIARLNRLTDDAPTGAVDARPELLEHAAPISRSDVATFLVDQAESRGSARVALNVTRCNQSADATPAS